MPGHDVSNFVADHLASSSSLSTRRISPLFMKHTPGDRKGIYIRRIEERKSDIRKVAVEGLEDSFSRYGSHSHLLRDLGRTAIVSELPSGLLARSVLPGGYGRRPGRKEKQRKEDGAQAEENAEANFLSFKHTVF